LGTVVTNGEKKFRRQNAHESAKFVAKSRCANMSRIKLMGADPTCDQINDWFKIGGPRVRVETTPQSVLGGYPLDPDTGKAAVVSYRPVCSSYRRYKNTGTSGCCIQSRLQILSPQKFTIPKFEMVQLQYKGTT